MSIGDPELLGLCDVCAHSGNATCTGCGGLNGLPPKPPCNACWNRIGMSSPVMTAMTFAVAVQPPDWPVYPGSNQEGVAVAFVYAG